MVDQLPTVGGVAQGSMEVHDRGGTGMQSVGMLPATSEMNPVPSTTLPSSAVDAMPIALPAATDNTTGSSPVVRVRRSRQQASVDGLAFRAAGPKNASVNGSRRRCLAAAATPAAPALAPVQTSSSARAAVLQALWPPGGLPLTSAREMLL